MGGGGANKPLINSLNTLNTFKNSNPKELAKNLNKIQESKIKESNLDFNLQKDSKIAKDSKITKKSKLQSLQKDSKIQPKTLSKISISIIASILLSQSLVALPSGGKFTHGSGSIKVNGKEMDITGNNTNHIIAWGGGFNINKGEIVEFNTSHKQQASFLNLDYTNKASQILGNLNGNGNNIYLVNPSGVLIGQNASINANKFVASNTIDNTTLNSFKTQTKLVESFSPVYKPNKGNVVNLGTINANHIVLIGNEVRNQAIVKENGKEVIVTGSFSGYDAKNPNQTNASTKNLTSLELRGEKIDLALDNVKLDSNTKVNLSANNPINITQSTESLYHNGDRLNHNFTISSLDSTKQNPTANKYASISDITDWYYFANGINDKTIDQTQINDFRLINDIDFSANQEISLNGGNKLNFSGNYADPNGDDNYDDAMIVGGYDEMLQKEKVFAANFDGGGNTLSNVDIDYNDNNNRVFSLQIGVFGNIIIEDSSKAQITIKNLIIDGINMSISSDRHGGIGGFAGQINGGTFSNIILKNIGSISHVGLGDTSFGIGGFAGWIDGGTFSNIILSNIESIKAVNDIPKSSPILTVGGFVGEVFDASFSDIVLENFGTISSIIDNERSYYTQSFVGGFAGRNWDKNSFSNIVLNNIGAIKSKFSSDDVRNTIGVYSGGFIGGIESGGGIFSNIILNNIGTISSKNSNSTINHIAIASSGGFVGSVNNYSNSNLTFENIYLYFDSNSTILAEANNGTAYKGKFYGGLSRYNKPTNIVKPDFSNIHLYYKNGTLNGVDSDSKDYHSTNNPNGQIFLHTYLDSSQGIEDFSFALKSANSSVFKDNPISWKQDSNGNYNYYFANSVTSTPTPPNINDSTTNTLPTLDMDNLFNKGGYFDSSSWLTKDDFNQSILDSILGKDNQGNSNLIFDLLTQDLESIRQSLDFLVSFLDGENDIKELFGDYYKVNDNIYGALNQDLTINLKFSNFIEALKQNKNINLAFLKDYRDKLNTYNQNKELYQSGGLPSLEQESLKKLLEEQYNELLNLEQTAKTNLESLQGLIKDSFKMDTNYAIFAKESLSPLNFTINIGSLNNFEDTQGNGDNNNRFTPPSEIQKIADLASKEAILILPAQEKQEAIVEDGKERGRLCIVSDNAKTNNPCMAITY